MIRRSVSTGLAGGLLAGAAVGGVEAIAAWMHVHGAREVPPLGWALVAYAIFGAAAGMGAGIVAGAVGTDAFAPALAGVGGALTIVVGRFRMVRDVFLGQAPQGRLATLVQLAAILGVVALALGLVRLLRGVSTRLAWPTRPVPAALIVLVVAGAASGAMRLRPAPPVPPEPTRAAAPAGAPNVIIVMIDTLRADRLSCYGATGIKTPHIDALAADGTRFAHAFAQASWTRPSTATILTGLYPSAHGAVHEADILPDRVDTLAEQLQRAGYQTAGFADNINISPAFNFQQGFDEYRYLAPDMFFWADEQAGQLTLYSGLRVVRERLLSRWVDVHNYYRPADEVTAEVKKWLAGRGADQRPFFLYVHYMDAHDPYMVHPFNGEGYARVAMPNPPVELQEKLSRLYDSGVVYADEHIGALFDDLKARGLYDKTLVVLTADHGEEFHEHGGWWHGTTLYDEQIHIPLIVKPPHPTSPGRVLDEFATHLDIAPTILTAAGVPLPKLPGHALPLDGGAAPSRQSVFSEEDFEGNVLEAVRTPEWKLMMANPGNPRGLTPEELYGLVGDPGERQNVATTKPGEREAMRAELGKSVIVAGGHAGATQQGVMGSTTNERLKSLGYVGD